MSYSHSTIKPTKAEAVADLMRQFDEITVPQFSVHKRDRAAVESNLHAVVRELEEDGVQHVSASINGYISYTRGPGTPPFSQGPEEIQSISISASASRTAPKVAA